MGWASPQQAHSPLWLIPLVIVTLFVGLWYENHGHGGDKLRTVAARSRPVKVTSHGVHVAVSVMRPPYDARVFRTAEGERLRVGGSVPGGYVVFHITNPTKTRAARMWDVSVHVGGRGWINPMDMGTYVSQLAGSHGGPPYMEQSRPGTFTELVGPHGTGDVVRIVPSDGVEQLIFEGGVSPDARIDKVRFRISAETGR